MHGKANPGRSFLRNLAAIRAKWLLLPALVLCCGGSAAQEKPLPIREMGTRPNVLVVLMDDLGWRDLETENTSFQLSFLGVCRHPPS